MNVVNFRYNKYSESTLYIMILLNILIGLLIYAAIMYYSGIARGPEYAPEYFRTHTEHAVYFMFGLLPVFTLIPMWMGFKSWGRSEKTGRIDLYEDYAVIYFDNKEICINKGELRIKSASPRSHWYNLYILKIPKKKIKFCTSIIESKEKRGNVFGLSLDIAMDRLEYYRKQKKGDQSMPHSATFYEMEIVFGITTPEIFDNSPYYVEYNSPVIIPGAPFVTCLIRDRKEPIHVVGDMEIDIRMLNKNDYDENVLRKQPILAVIELDEKIGL